jgi:SAM-dependent methyltransferase
MTEYIYAGSELALFEKARNWKAYFRGVMAPYIHGDVLEAGAGIGANTIAFSGLSFRRWTCLEPDRQLLDQLSAALPGGRNYEVTTGTLEDLPAARKFDAILYIDVLEHIEDDRAEMKRAASHLNAGGALIVLAPAHPWLYTPFDQAIGHFRRYTRASLAAVSPPGANLERVFYLDSAGMLASLGNRLLLKSRMPTEAQIRTWDSLLVPISRLLDPLLFRRVGKSVVGVWRAKAAA